MGTIKIDLEKSITQTIRLKEGTVKKIDTVVENINKLTSENISKVFIIEQLIMHAIDNSKFEINGVEYSFEDLLNKFNPEEA